MAMQDWIHFYILDGHTPILVADGLTWGRWFETADRHVAWTQVGDVHVSTIFLGLDHNYGWEGPPLLYETLVFGGALADAQARYATWEDAEHGHAAIVAAVRAALDAERLP